MLQTIEFKKDLLFDKGKIKINRENFRLYQKFSGTASYNRKLNNSIFLH